MIELRPSAARQYIDAVATFEAWEEALADADQVRGGMYWHKGPANAPEQQYLVRTSSAGGEKSLGARSPQTQEIYDRFHDRKRQATERLFGLGQALDEHRRLNRALRVGRVDPIVVRILGKLHGVRLAEHFRVVGTHALYAYEAAAGVALTADAVSTRDIDLLWDVRKRMRFDSTLSGMNSSMLGVLKQVDPSFRVRRSKKETAANRDGFEVDILRREKTDDDPHPIRLSEDEDDFWVVQAHKAHLLQDAEPFSSVIVSSNGEMARMNTIHPTTFVHFKRWMSTQSSRDPIKRRRDALQADVVEELLSTHLSHLVQDPNARPRLRELGA
jgi:hypothetical protein